MPETYNGWKNYYTWAMYCWLTSEEGTYKLWRDTARDVARANHDAPDAREHDRRALRDMAYLLTDWVEENRPRGGVWGDLLGHAIAQIDFDAIAKAFLAEIS